MTMTDPVADFLTRLRNASKAHHESLSVPYSKLKGTIADILKAEGYIDSYKVEDAKVGKSMVVNLKYGVNREASIAGIKRVSKPGLPGTEQELFSLDELVQSFDFDHVNKAGARFDPEKIKWYNHQYIQRASNTELAQQLITTHKVLNGLDQNYVELVIGLIKERADLVPDLWRLGKYFFEAPDRYDEKSLKKAWREDTNVLLTELVSVLENANDESAKSIKIAVSDWIISKDIGFGKIMMPLRVALVGALEGIDVFDIVFYIGKKETIGRINALIQHQA